MGKRILNEALSKIVNAERRGKATAQLQPVSNMIASFLQVMKNRVGLYCDLNPKWYFGSRRGHETECGGSGSWIFSLIKSSLVLS
ncbi:hypothetical protein AQUCO_00100144v1 [Aquilegia coerulea]|uniref:30S ribosomal protein S8, chloroplastic n=1 Tax=Aquilegia coerulea TaxID=218851 RepID=A0A2G5F943_AQUCA|nr:hypothetical protein AQUCO_00100144v1 [Aquilegia coerulea]